jgi:hypothetical protein
MIKKFLCIQFLILIFTLSCSDSQPSNSGVPYHTHMDASISYGTNTISLESNLEDWFSQGNWCGPALDSWHDTNWSTALEGAFVYVSVPLSIEPSNKVIYDMSDSVQASKVFVYVNLFQWSDAETAYVSSAIYSNYPEIGSADGPVFTTSGQFTISNNTLTGDLGHTLFDFELTDVMLPLIRSNKGRRNANWPDSIAISKAHFVKK